MCPKISAIFHLWRQMAGRGLNRAISATINRLASAKLAG
jgi:hypothetical protein